MLLSVPLKLISSNSQSTSDRVTCRACDSHSLRYVTYGALPADYYYYYYYYLIAAEAEQRVFVVYLRAHMQQ